MFPTNSRRRPLAGLAAAAVLAVAACGSNATPVPITPAPAVTPAAAASASAVAPTSPPAAGATPAAPTAAAATPTAPAVATPTPAPSSAGYTGPDVTITYSIWGDPTEIKAQQALADAFHQANPKITVKVTVADWDTYWDKLQTSLAGGDAPDVFAMDGPLFPDYQSRDVLLDLAPYIARDGFDLSQLSSLAVKDFTTAGGQFGLPRDLNVVALYYNKAMFTAAGIAFPDETWDWAKLRDVAAKLTTRSTAGAVSQWGFYTETTDMENYWSSLVWQAGGDILAPDGKSTVLGTPEAATGIQFLQDLIWKDKVMPDPATALALGDAFEQGKAAMEANGSWLVATHQAAGIDFGIAPLPSGPAGRVTSVNPTGVVVYKKSKAPEAAWAFVRYIAGEAAQERLMALKSAMPANTTVLAGPYGSSFDGAKVLADALAYAHLKPSFASYNEFTTALQGELDPNVFGAPNKTAAQALADVVPALDKLLAGK